MSMIKHINPILVLVQPRKTHPYITERLLMGRKEWNQTNTIIYVDLQECYLENDNTSMFYAAQSLVMLQTLYGIIPNIHGKGECAKVGDWTLLKTGL